MHQGILQHFIEWVIHHGGLFVLLAILFAETGLFLGFFLPGDSLLFAAGIYINDLAATFFGVHYLVILGMMILASFAGTMVGYWFGVHSGQRMFQWKDRWFFKKKYLERAKLFYEKYGKGTVFLSKFVPLIRTFAPILAGIVKMRRNSFIIYNIAGSTVWVSAMVLGGHYLQNWCLQKFDYSLKDHIETSTVAIIIVTTFPILYKFIFSKKTVITKEGMGK